MPALSLVDRGFIGGVMVRRARLESGRSWVLFGQICFVLRMFLKLKQVNVNDSIK